MRNAMNSDAPLRRSGRKWEKRPETGAPQPADDRGRSQGKLSAPGQMRGRSMRTGQQPVASGRSMEVGKFADKPGSVERPRRTGTIGQSFLWAPRYHGALAAYPGATRATPMLPYLALPRMGFAVPVLLPVLRWALTRRGFHPDRRRACARHRTVSPLPVPIEEQAPR